MLELAITMDSQGVVKTWSVLAENLLGYASERAVGHRLGDLIVPEPMRRYHEMGLRRFVETREPHCVGNVYDLEAVHEQGHLVAITLRIDARRTGDDDLIFEAFMSG